MALRTRETQMQALRRILIGCGEIDCVDWPFTRDRDGYGVVWFRGAQGKAHRVSYELIFSRPSPGEVVRHTCDNPSCVNPHHLITGSHADNVRDRVERHRGVCGARHPKAKLTASDVVFIRSTAAPKKELANRFGVSPQAIHSIRLGRVWKSAGGC